MSDWIDNTTWNIIQKNMPILCVDIVLTRNNKIGLTLRKNPFGNTPVWCHLGGRVNKNETTTEALKRHLQQTVTGTNFDKLPEDLQPDYVMQWFEREEKTTDQQNFGFDPRQTVRLMMRF